MNHLICCLIKCSCSTHTCALVLTPLTATHRNTVPVESDKKLIEVARKLETYGMRPQPCKNKNNVEMKVAVSYIGVVIFQVITRVTGGTCGGEK